MRKLRTTKSLFRRRRSPWAVFGVGTLVALCTLYYGDQLLQATTQNTSSLESEHIGSLQAALASFQSSSDTPAHHVYLARQLANASLPFVYDVVCRGCRRPRPTKTAASASASAVEAPIEASEEDCAAFFLEKVWAKGLVAASAQVLEHRHPNSCEHCWDCSAAGHYYWKYDRVLRPSSDRVNNPSSSSSSSRRSTTVEDHAFALSSSSSSLLSPPVALIRPYWYASMAIPESHRLSESVLRGNPWTDFLLQRNNNRNTTDHQQSELFFDYNPSIVRLPVQHPLRHASRERKRGGVDSTVAATIEYVASFRASNLHACFPPADRVMLGRPTKSRDYLGLALLDNNLNVLEADVFDIKSSFPSGQDFRLFVLHDELYVSSYDAIAPLAIMPMNLLSEPPPENHRKLPRAFEDSTDDRRRRRRRLLGAVLVRSYASCAPCGRPRGYCGKNFNYFTANAKPGKAYVEIWPSPPHTVRVVDLHAPCQRDAAIDATTTFVDNAIPPRPSFATVEELYFPSVSLPQQQQQQQQSPLLTRGRGGACCVPIQHDHRSYLVGIEHVKTPSQQPGNSGRNDAHGGGGGGFRNTVNVTANHYLSRLYAFAPDPPFRIIARSGLFCLGFGPLSHPLVDATRWRTLVLGGSFQDCPRIHFVSGLTVIQDNPSSSSSASSASLLIAYGINDCVSAMARVSLKHVQQLLFGTPPLHSS